MKVKTFNFACINGQYFKNEYLGRHIYQEVLHFRNIGNDTNRRTTENLYLKVNVFETSWRIYIEIFLDFINDIITVEITIWTKTYVFVV